PCPRPSEPHSTPSDEQKPGLGAIMVQSGVSSGRAPKTSQRAKLKASECVPRPCYHADMTTKDENLWSECRCGAQWDGLWKEHCAECHSTCEASLLGLHHPVGHYVPNTRRGLSIHERTGR